MTHVIGESDRQEAAELGIVRGSDVASIGEIEDEGSLQGTVEARKIEVIDVEFQPDPISTFILGEERTEEIATEARTVGGSLTPEFDTRAEILGEAGAADDIARQENRDKVIPKTGPLIPDVNVDIDIPGPGDVAGALVIVGIILAVALFGSSFAKGAGRGATGG